MYMFFKDYLFYIEMNSKEVVKVQLLTLVGSFPSRKVFGKIAKRLGHWTFQRGFMQSSVLAQACMWAGARSHPSPIMFLSGDLPKGAMSAWSRAKLALYRVLATKVCVGLKCSIYKCVVKYPGCHQRNDLLGLPILPCYRGNLFWE